VILGLTGSLGSGKSTVARMLEELGGAVMIDADAIAYEVQKPGGSAYGDIVAAFGREILKPDGTLDRRKLAAEVFSDPAKRERLNRIVHPRVREVELGLLDAHRGDPLVVLMVPLLLENGMQTLVDRVVVVTADDTQRRRRLWERSGMTGEEVDRRLASQMPEAEKIRHAHHLIDNGGSLEQTRLQVLALLGQLGVARRHTTA
jgi:dephospho-CoA kinase